MSDTLLVKAGARTGIAEVASQVPSMAFLYKSAGKRFSLDNATRSGFKSGDTEGVIPELRGLITDAAELHSHQQGKGGDKKNPLLHKSEREWCESWDGNRTSVDGFACAECAAKAYCATQYKIQLTFQLVDDEEEYLLTVPTVSAIRLRLAAQKLAATTGKHLSQVMTVMTVHSEKSKAGNDFPAVEYAFFDLQTGAALALNGNPQPKPQPTAQHAMAPKPIPAAPITYSGDTRADAKAIVEAVRARWRGANPPGHASLAETKRLAAILGTALTANGKLGPLECDARRYKIYSAIVGKPVASGDQLPKGAALAMLLTWSDPNGKGYTPTADAVKEIETLLAAVLKREAEERETKEKQPEASVPGPDAPATGDAESVESYDEEDDD
jgi:hypothetical protein